jgi:hypothetical protein
MGVKRVMRFGPQRGPRTLLCLDAPWFLPAWLFYKTSGARFRLNFFLLVPAALLSNSPPKAFCLPVGRSPSGPFAN